MSETLDVVQAEPGGWLAEMQRTRCNGATPLTTYQGLISDEIVLPQSAANADDPARLVGACSAFTDALLNQRHFIEGEFAPEALWSFYANDYLQQVIAGGHAQYFANRGGDELAVRSCMAGLKSMLADPQWSLLNLMLRLKRNPPKLALKTARQRGYRDVAAALRDIDAQFLELERTEPLTVRHKIWLKSLRKLKLVPDAEISPNLGRIAGANALRGARAQERERIRAEHERTDPAFIAARALCEQAGLRFGGLKQLGFAPMRTVWAEGPDRRAFMHRVETDCGARTVVFYVDGGFSKRRLAALIEPGAALPLGSLNLSKAEFAAIVPAR